MSNMLTAAAADLEASQAEYLAAEAAFNEACDRKSRALQRLVKAQSEMARHLSNFESRAPQGTPWNETRALLRNSNGGEGK
jgi:hypothetical protein